MINKLGLPYMKEVVPEEHQKLLNYIEREKRKIKNKSEKKKLMELLGKEDKDIKKES